MGNRTSILLLPSEILSEIFLLLPFESVIACKLVSRDWKNIIEDSNFVKHCQVDTATFFLDNHILKSVSVKKDKKSYESRQIETYAKFSLYLELLLESSNKIACIKTTSGEFLLYNLLTGDSRVVTDAPVRSYSSQIWSFLGFGYDPYEDDYKIIVICKSVFRFPYVERKRFGLNEDDTKRNSIFIYSYKNGSWKHREGFEENEYEWSVRGACGFAINGVLHWILIRKDATSCILGLDLNTYGLVQFRFPPLSRSEEYLSNSDLTSFKGRLCCFIQKVELDVWVMEEYGVAESWRMLLRTGLSEIDTGFAWFEGKHMRIYQDTDSGEIVLFIHDQMRSRLYGFDAGTGQRRAYIQTPRPNNKTQVGFERLKTMVVKACCLWPDV